jgi:hypothetical protein
MFVRSLRAAAILGAVTLTPAGVAAAAYKFTRLDTVNASPAQAAGMTRTADGALHLVYQTYSGRAVSGLGAISLSPAGKPGPVVQALAGWSAGQPGLVALANGTLETVFGAVSPGLVSSVWGISSSDGGASWATPADVKGGGPTESLAYGSDVTAVMSGSTPVIALPQAGNLVVQQGLGPGSPSYQVNGTADGSLTDADLGVDAATGQVVAGWQSIASNPTDYLQAAAPSLGTATAMTGESRTAVVLAGRDKESGVFGAFTTDNTHVRLQRYGGGAVAVGAAAGVTAKRLGVATGPDGRIWVMWGDDGGTSGHVAVTRSNKAATRFEPIQQLNPNAFGLARLQGDGRLGPLDLLVDELPAFKGNVPPPGLFYTRVLPELSATVSVAKVKNKLGKVTGFKLTVKVTDAGDAVSGATVSAAGKKGKTSSAGVAKLTPPAGAAPRATVTVTSPGYLKLSHAVKL